MVAANELRNAFTDLLKHIKEVDLDRDGRADNKNIFIKGNNITAVQKGKQEVSISGDNIRWDGDDCLISGRDISFTGEYGVIIGNNIHIKGNGTVVIGNEIS